MPMQISIREIFWGVLTGKYNATDFGDKESDLFMRVDGHTGHCFDYLRQGIQCASDITFEGVVEGTEQAITGWNMEHKNCRSFVSTSNIGKPRCIMIRGC